MTYQNTFLLDDISRSSTAVRMGIDNAPNAFQAKNATLAVVSLEQVRELLAQPMFIDSWLRTEKLERIIAQPDYSSWCKRHSQIVNYKSWTAYYATKAHPTGYAIDFICPAFGTPAQICAKIRASGIKYDKLICEGTWVHISFAPTMRMSYLIATFNAKGEPSYEEVA